MMIEPPRFTSNPPRGRSEIAPVLIVVLGAILVVGAVGFIAGYITANATGSQDRGGKLNAFLEAWDVVDQQFYYDKPSPEERARGAIQGMIATLNDKYTLLMEPQLAAADATLMAGESGGIGAKIMVDESGNVLIAEVLLGKPAEEAGVKSGDIILAVDDTPLKGANTQAAINKVRGLIGTQVKLTLKRGTEVLNISITRAQINVYGKMLPGKIGYVSLSIFSGKSTDQLREAIDPLLNNGAKALIFDLRGNPGGLLEQAVNVADLFLPNGVIVREKSSIGGQRTFTAKSGDLAETIPLYVLVDGGSASASEIVAGALKDRERAILIGQTTYGKGSVQTLFNLTDKSELRVTTGAWYTPNDRPIQKIGLPVDLWVTTPDIFPAGSDPILDAAVQFIEKGGPDSF